MEKMAIICLIKKISSFNGHTILTPAISSILSIIAFPYVNLPVAAFAEKSASLANATA